MGEGVKKYRDRKSGWAGAEQPMGRQDTRFTQQYLIVAVSMPSGISEPHSLKPIVVVDFGRTSRASSGFLGP